MNSKKAILFIIVIICLAFVFLGILSFRFLTLQVRKSLEEDPAIMAQYELKLNIDQFRKLKNKLNSIADSP